MKRSIGQRRFQVFNVILLTLVGFTTIYPFLNTLAISLSEARFLDAGEVFLVPRGFQLSAYRTVIRDPRYLDVFLNTVVVTVVGTMLSIVLTTLGAYPLSRKSLKGRGIVITYILITMFFSGGYIPTYLLIRDLGMLNRLSSLIVPGAISTWNLIILRNFFQAIPQSLEESARIDGANDLTVLVRIVLPLSLPAIATISLFYAVSDWNTFFNALIYITDSTKQVLQVYLSEFFIDPDKAERNIRMFEEQMERLKLIPESLRAATVICTVAPILLAYPWIQKYFVKGVMIGSLKG